MMGKRTAVLRAAFPRFEIREGGKAEAWAAQANGENGVWRVWVWSGIDRRAAVAAQEVYEWTWRQLVGLSSALASVAIVAAGATLLEPLLWWLAPLAAWAAYVLVPQLHAIQRRKELMSHEVEAQAAALLYGGDVAAYRLGEVGDRGHPERGGMVTYPWLNGISERAIYERMEANAGKALRHVLRRLRFLTTVRDFEFEGVA